MDQHYINQALLRSGATYTKDTADLVKPKTVNRPDWGVSKFSARQTTHLMYLSNFRRKTRTL
ncbi:hypothetical protein J6590_106001 [Homalodisca vitripennis]|nr:hypothetical protein J6590_106001 [Homalodisca vitripennis]